MSYAKLPNPIRLAASARTMTIALVAALISCEAIAEDQTRSLHPYETRLAHSGTLADLEKVFWTCDYAASTIGMLDIGAALLCGQATRDLRLKKFEGDYEAMWAWWRRNKSHEHRSLNRTYCGVGHSCNRD